ncbi:hypothetical protein ACIBSW_12465 [Actinoplanes sp. NPDC049668]|uniref:hypothetical protein n=1 Tax=unclassified Actinoplanes TaxID=2626549 RepID=UPI0033AC9A9F
MVDELSPVLASAGSTDEALSVLLGLPDTYSGTGPVSAVYFEAYLAATRDDALSGYDSSVAIGRRRYSRAGRG